MKTSHLRVTQLKSIHGNLIKHKLCIKGLGLRRIGHSVVVENTPSVMGLIDKVRFMVKVEEIS